MGVIEEEEESQIYASENEETEMTEEQTEPELELSISYIGCFEGYLPYSQIMDEFTYDYTPDMSVTVYCGSQCKIAGFQYFSLQEYGECSCGDSSAGFVAISPSLCNQHCTNDDGTITEICGASVDMGMIMYEINE